MAIIKNEIPILEFDTEQTAVLNPTHENLGLNLPKKCVFAFLGAYIDEYASKSDTKQVSTFESATKHYPIYITKYKGEDIVLCQAPVGAAAATQILDWLIGYGVSHVTKSIKVNRDENPAYYDSFSKRIKTALEDYKNRVITEAEYLDKMKSILADYRKGTTNIVYPEKIKGNLHAQAFYGVIAAILDDVIDMGPNIETVSDISLEVTKIIEKHDTVDWQTNKDIHNKIAQDIDDLFYDLEKNHGFKVDFDTIDKIIENVITVALRRFK